MSSQPRIYYLFSVLEGVFRDLSLVLAQRHEGVTFCGLGYAHVPELEDSIFDCVSYISDWMPPYSEPVDAEFLTQIEKTYGVIVSDMIHMDRHLMRLPIHQRLPLAQCILKAFLTDVAEQRITLIIASGLADFISFFAHKYAQEEGLGFVYVVPARMGRNMFLSSDPTTGPRHFKATFDRTYASFLKEPDLQGPANAFIRDYVQGKEQPSYVQKKAGLLFKVFSLSDLVGLWQLFKRVFQDSKGLHYNISPWKAPFNRLLKIFRAKQYWRLMDRHAVPVELLKGSRYLVYPIHFHPEASTLVQGRFFNDQLRIVEMISKALSADIKLVIKEHKVSVGRNTLGFYKALMNHHNVVFVRENICVYTLLENAIGVVTIASSMGLETLMLGKPVLAFGDVFYTVSNNVIQAKDFTQMKAYIQALETHVFDPVDRSALFSVMMDHFVDMGRLDSTHADYRESLDRYADALVRFGFLGS